MTLADLPVFAGQLTAGQQCQRALELTTEAVNLLLADTRPDARPTHHQAGELATALLALNDARAALRRAGVRS